MKKKTTFIFFTFLRNCSVGGYYLYIIKIRGKETEKDLKRASERKFSSHSLKCILLLKLFRILFLFCDMNWGVNLKSKHMAFKIRYKWVNYIFFITGCKGNLLTYKD